MKDWMTMTRSWKLQFISNSSNALQHQIRPEELVAEFMDHSFLHRLLNMGLQFDMYRITYLKFPFMTVFVFFSFHPLLSSLEIVLN